MNALPQGIVLGLLSDREFRPAALRLAVAGTDPARTEALLRHPLFAELAGRFPCIIAADDATRWPSELLQAAEAAGCRVAAEGTLLILSAFSESPLPTAIRHVGDGWYLQSLAKPAVDKTGSRALALKLAQLVANDADTREIEDVFRHEPTLSYHLLRLVNSPGVGAGRVISNFAQAILILGRNQLRRWLNLLLFAARKDDPRAAMLMAHATRRARLLELLAKAAGLDGAGREHAFMTGMFSMLGIVFGMPLLELLRPLKVDESVVAALLHHEGPIGGLLRVVEASERGELDSVAAGLALPAGTDIDLLAIEASLWMLTVVLEGPGAGDV